MYGGMRGGRGSHHDKFGVVRSLAFDNKGRHLWFPLCLKTINIDSKQYLGCAFHQIPGGIRWNLIKRDQQEKTGEFETPEYAIIQA